MTHTKHTPGPWELGDEYGAEIIGNGKIVATTMNTMLATKKQQAFGVLGFDELDELKANAHLIAAAPELFEVAKALLGWDFRNNRTHFVDMAKAAIAKAEGGAA